MHIYYYIIFRIVSPFLLFAIVGSYYISSKLYKRHTEKKVVILGHELSLTQQYGIMSLCLFPIFYLVGAGAAIFWVLGVSFFLVILHASFYNIDAVVPDDQSELELLQTV